MNAQDLAAEITARAKGREGRFMVAVAGPPGAGKSTVAADLVQRIGPGARVVPMDGFHYDDAVLRARGLQARKGAPDTFDVMGFRHLVTRLKAEAEVAIPIFDRSIELSRAAADIVGPGDRILVLEGNYLLLDQDPWSALAPEFDLTVFLSVPMEDLLRRLTARWRHFGKSAEAAAAWIAGNDLPNVQTVLNHSRQADITLITP
jgi:pantothenate kinase